MKNKTVMFAGSQGGHYKELMGLRNLFLKYESILVTDNKQVLFQPDITRLFCSVEVLHAMSDSREKLAGSTTRLGRFKQINSFMRMFMECFKAYKKYKPSILISTGSYIAVPLFISAKLHGTKTIFIESNAMVYSKTLTGKLVEKLSDKIYVQWPEMLDVYPKAEYHGILH